MEDGAPESNPYVSIIIPVYNEEDNLAELARELENEVRSLERNWELVIVEDGSEDGTWDKLRDCFGSWHNGDIRLIRLARNYGQTVALRAGLDVARGSIIVTMDGDLQNDPADIHKLIEKVEEGYDVASGWRKKRRDPLLTRRLPSWLGNKLVSWQAGLKLHDYGCSLKAYRGEIIRSIHLYGEMHRLVPALARWMGASVAEVEVNHRHRGGGESKYNMGRVFAVILDLISVRFFSSYATRPTHVIGMWGIIAILLSGASIAALIYMKLWMGVNMTGNPFLYISVMLFIVGVQLIALGLLGEINIRSYYEIQDKVPYRVKETRVV